MSNILNRFKEQSEEELEELYIRIKVAHRDEEGEFVSFYEEDGIIYEEVAIHDYETEIEGLEIDEYDNIEKLSNLVESCEELHEINVKSRRHQDVKNFTNGNTQHYVPLSKHTARSWKMHLTRLVITACMKV